MATAEMEAVAPVYADSPYRIHFPTPDRMSTPLVTFDRVDFSYGDEAGRVLADRHSQRVEPHRATAEYRRHAVGVLTRRLARRASQTEVAA